MEQRKVLFIDTTHPALPDGLTNLGFCCDSFASTDYNELLRIAPQYVGFVIRSKFRIEKDLIDRATALKFIARVGAGMENINTDYATQKGIACINSPEGNRDAVGEHAVGMLLCLFNNVLRADQQVRQGSWQREANRGVEIKGKTIAIIGYGNMGGSFARKLSGFGARVIAYDKYKTHYSDAYAQEVDMQEVFDQADVVSFHVPYTAETHHMGCAAFFNQFRKPIWLINTSRGKVVNTADLVQALKDNRIHGACLDVLEYESTNLQNKPIEEWDAPMQYLAASDRVVLTPHIAGWTHESNVKLSQVIVDKVAALFSL